MKPFLKLLTLSLLLSATTLQACHFLDNTLCGQTLNAAPEAFIEHLGQPSARLNFADQRLGLLFGPQLMLMFSDNRLRQVLAWSEQDSPFSALDLEPAAAHQLHLGLLNPWQRSRQQLDLALQNWPQTHTTPLQQVRLSGPHRLQLNYRPSPNSQEGQGPEHFKLERLQLDLAP